MRRQLVWLMAVLLAGCCGHGMTDSEVRVAKARCWDQGGEAVVMAHLDGRITSVRCL